MFTGIIQDMGTITALDKQGDWIVDIEAPLLDLSRTQLGASIACAGICLTVIALEGQIFRVQVSTETLSKTTAITWKVGQKINLEPALRMGDELGGHLLSGHVDGVAYLMGKHQEQDSLRLRIEAPRHFLRFIASKGTVALDGVSLTINEVEGLEFGINLIPHTQQHTTLATLEVGQAINFEVDMIARYVERMLGGR